MNKNTIIVPTHETGITFLLNNKYWDNLRLGKEKIKELEYISFYQANPISAITHYSKIEKIEMYEVPNVYRGRIRYRIYIGKLNKIFIPLEEKNNRKLVIQSLRYTENERLLSSKNLRELFD